METTPGSNTSEYKITFAAILFGGLLEASVLPTLTWLHTTYPNAQWLAIAIGLSGVLLQICVAFGYVKGRANVKVEQLRQQGIVATQELITAGELARAKAFEAANKPSAPSP